MPKDMAQSTTIFTRRESEARSYCRGMPAVFTSASGSEMTDDTGKTWIDFLAGCSSLNYGHNDPDMKAALIELGEWTAEDDDVSVAVGESQPFELLIVDSVKKRIKALKEYFAKHEFETSFVSHPDVAIERLKGSNPPDGILVLADHFTDEAVTAFPQMQAYGRSKKVPCLAVFPQEVEDRVNKAIRSTRFGATAFQPATLREIRLHFEEVGAITRSM